MIAVRGVAAAVLFTLWAILASANSRGLDITRTTVYVKGLPEALDGLRIAQVSDFHSSSFGPGQQELLDAIAGFRPDFIALTGDLIDGVTQQSAPCLELARALAAIAPVYYVRGNHEYYLDRKDRARFEADLKAAGVVALHNRSAVLSRNGREFLLSGMDDVSRRVDSLREREIGRQEFEMETAREFMAGISDHRPPGDFPLSVMLCHRPHYWSLWEAEGYDLALCGHLHGWIARLPGLGGILRNPSRFFPEEDAGLYHKGSLQVYISRGLDKLATWRNPRMNNRPELALIEVKNKHG